MLKRNDLKPNLASFQKFLPPHCWHSPPKGGGWGGREGGQMKKEGGQDRGERGVGKEA